MDPVLHNLSGITIQRLEKPKPRQEVQNPPPQPVTETESSDKNKIDEEKKPVDTVEIQNVTKRIIDTADLQNITKRIIDTSDLQNITKRIIDTTNLQNVTKRLIDNSNLQNVTKRVIDTTDLQTLTKRIINTTDLQNLNKRNLDDSVTIDPVAKKLKITQSEISITEKPRIFTPVSLPKSSAPSDIPTDEELSDFGSESEFESESEVDNEIATIKNEAATIFNNETKIETTDPNFLEKLVDDSFLDKSVPDIVIKTECDSLDTDDYDYDITEKLKEMGEISLETVKKGDKSKNDSSGENEATATPSKKIVEDDVVIERKGPGGGVISSSMMRRNIREVMDEAKLDESTLAAQREEAERLQRVQEQQRLIREVQRQMAQERMQNKVLSLLQGGSLSKAGSSSTRIGNTVLVKLPNGETKPMTKVAKQPFDLVKIPKGPPLPQKTSPVANLTSLKKLPGPGPATSQGQLTPSVSIAPVSKKLLPPSLAYSDSEGEYEDPRARAFFRGKPPKPATSTTAEPTSDDDCIVVSDTEGEPLDDETVEDPANSGMHTNDDFNQPDEHGRVVVNIGHPDGEPDIYLAPQIARIIKPHQVGGVRFLYDNVIESINRFDNSTGFGCILAHSMGLGKTLQVVCFSDIFLRYTSSKTILCIMPINTLQNWLAEYNMWLPAEEEVSECPLSAQGVVRPRTFSLYVLNDSHKTLTSRSKVVQAWRSSGGVLLIGYEQYRLLSLRKLPKSRRKPHLIQPEDEDKNRKLLDDIHHALVMPGPDLVICDEGHRIKNSHASISQALKQMRTKRRVVLTGYPLQNNLMEYWCMVDFVRPNYLGSKSEFCNMFERPIQNGQCMDSTQADIKLMRYRAHVLHSLLVGFVQRRSHDVLQNALPRKEEYVFLLRMTDFQRKVYNVFMNEVVRCQTVPNPLKAFAVCCKIWNHPDVLYNFLKKRAGGEAVDIDLEEVSNTSSAIVNGPASKAKRTPKRSTTPKGRRSTKPAASVTPNNTREEEKPPPRLRRGNFVSPNPGPDTSEIFHNENANFPSPSLNNQQSTSTYFGNQSSEANSQLSFANNFSQSGPTSFSNFSSNTSQASSSNSFQNIKQQLSFWSQQKELTEQFNNISKSQTIGGDMFNSTNSREVPSWRKDETKPTILNNIITSPLKSELFGSFSGSENKPKINIISDIKLGHFSSPLSRSTPDGKKINIISDIKLESKKEESADDKRFSKFNMDSVKNEIKPLMKSFEMSSRRISEDDDVKIISEMPPPPKMRDDAQDGIPYDWAVELLKDYIPGCIEYSAKTEVLFCIIRESIALGDRLLLFSQSLITLDVIEQFLHMNNVPGETEKWAKNTNYYRLDGSTSALEREKLINEFNSNPKIHLFLVSTRAGSLGINLVGANRVVVFDASWNPCHDTQAVCRVYRYGQRKPCFVYRFVMDHCLEKKIYDRQINKQGMSDRVVDECNPDSHVTIKDLSTLCFDDTEEGESKDWSCVKDNYIDLVLQKILELHGRCFNKPPFQHESLLVDRKDKQLSQQEKRLAKKGYEREKQASRQPTYSLAAAARSQRPIASVRPMLQGGERPSRWIPAEHWQRQGMTAQEMTLPLDVVIPTNQPDKSNIILKAGQKVLVLKSPKGVYMQLENGKIVAIKTAIKVRGKAEDDASKLMKPTFPPMKPPLPPPLPPNIPILPPKRMVPPFIPGHPKLNMRSVRQPVPNLVARMQGPRPRKPGPVPRGRNYQMGNEGAPPINLPKPDPENKKTPLPSEISQRITSDEIIMERYPAKNDRRPPTKVDLPEHASLLKSIQQRGAISISSPKSKSSAIQQLEESTSVLISETKQRIQDIHEITSSYQEEEKASASDSSSVAPIESDDMQDPDDTEELEDLDESYEDESELLEGDISDMNVGEAVIKSEGSQNQDYNYNGYYGYNQPYPHHPPPHQPYGSYPPPQPPPYDYGYGQPQQPPYNYGMYPQAYGPQPQYPPPQPYDPYAPHPPQPMYGGYHPPYPQQYPPPPSPYPPAAPPPHTYPDYQYNTAAAPPPAPQNPTPPTNPNYYPTT